MCVQELLLHEEKLSKLNQQMAIEKDLLKKVTQLDPYLEKLVELKLMQGKETFINKFNLNKGWSEDYTANKICKIKVRAVSLDFEVCKWIDKNLRGLRDCFEISQQKSLQNFNNGKIQNAKSFITGFFKRLEEQKTSVKLIRYIRDYTSCFGPKRLGSNLLIN
jgi:predicted O-linked N-acetylglucosamine transferase (SPINDLY family)